MKNEKIPMAKTILVIDDASDVVELLEFKLKKEGYEIVTAGNGVEGLEKIRLNKPDLILLDIVMPLMDGYTFVQEIKKIKDAANIPIIVVSVKDQMQDLFRIEGVRDFLVKPFAPDVLMARVSKYLN